MWTRKELKDKAKVAFRANYWKAVLAALVLVVVAGGMSSYSAMANGRGPSAAPATSAYVADDVNVDIRDGRIMVDVDGEDGGRAHVDMDADDVEDLAEAIGVATQDGRYVEDVTVVGPAMVLGGISVALIVLVLIAIAVAAYILLLNPLEVGAQRFFLRNLNQPAKAEELAYGYDNNYKEIVKTVFLRDLFVILWSLLLIIPGIYKSYEYRMIPYLLADDPTMTKDRAFAESKRMMDGNKWKTFVLDLSFLGWNILSLLTLGILGVFYVGPYQAQTNAALYEKLRYGLPAPEQPWQAAPVAGTAANAWPEPPRSAAYAQGATMPMAYAAAPVGAAAAVAEAGSTAPMAYGAASGVTAPMAGVTYPMAGATEPMAGAGDTLPMAGAVDATAPTAGATEPMTAAFEETAPVITPTSQPPIPPFAAVGAEVAEVAEAAESADEAAGQAAEAADEAASQAAEAADAVADEAAEAAAAEIAEADATANIDQNDSPEA